MQPDLKLASRAGRMQASEIRELLKLLDRPDIVSFAGGIPDPALFPADAFRDAMAEALNEHNAGKALQYAPSEGHTGLREWICGRMQGIGVECGLENIVLVSGSQQALDYLGKLFLSPGDTALVGWPTYLGALQAFNAYEPNYDRLEPMSNRAAESYAEAAREAGGAVKFAYASSDFGNPTGETLNETERQRILELAEALDIAVIEDGAYQALRYDGQAVASMLAMDIARSGGINNTRTIYCGTFSKTLSPGLRVGWVCARKDIVNKLVVMKQASDLHSPTLNQMAINSVARSTFDAQVEKTCKVYRTRRDAMLTALERYMPDGVSWSRPEGGMFIWVTLPAGMDGENLLTKSLEGAKVAFVPGRPFFADGSGANHLRLSFSCADEAMIDDGIKRLGQLVRDNLSD